MSLNDLEEALHGLTAGKYLDIKEDLTLNQA